jgi:hypothetical protein
MDSSLHLKILFSSNLASSNWRWYYTDCSFKVFSCDNNTNNQLSSINYEWSNKIQPDEHEDRLCTERVACCRDFFEVFLFSTYLFYQMDRVGLWKLSIHRTVHTFNSMSPSWGSDGTVSKKTSHLHHLSALVEKIPIRIATSLRSRCPSFTSEALSQTQRRVSWPLDAAAEDQLL